MLSRPYFFSRSDVSFIKSSTESCSGRSCSYCAGIAVLFCSQSDFRLFLMVFLLWLKEAFMTDLKSFSSQGRPVRELRVSLMTAELTLGGG